MKLKLFPNVAGRYIAYSVKSGGVNWEYRDMLLTLEGQEVEVETDFLFRDQFNTPAGVGCPLGLRIGSELVESVIDDIRPGPNLRSVHARQLRS